VNKETDESVWDDISELARQEKQMVIVDPDEIARPEDRLYPFRVRLICCDICTPVCYFLGCSFMCDILP